MRCSSVGFLFFVLSGCAVSTGILPAGPDTYTVTDHLAPIRGGGIEAKRVALSGANSFCQQQDRVFVPVTMDQTGNLSNPYASGVLSVSFLARCASRAPIGAFPSFRRCQSSLALDPVRSLGRDNFARHQKSAWYGHPGRSKGSFVNQRGMVNPGPSA